MKIAGLDIGTTGCKCTVFDEQGAYLDKAYRDYPVKRTLSGHEIDLSVVMDAVYAVIREMTGKFDDIAGIGVTSFGETCVCVDKEGKPVSQTMLVRIRKKFGFFWTGAKVHLAVTDKFWTKDKNGKDPWERAEKMVIFNNREIVGEAKLNKPFHS